MLQLHQEHPIRLRCLKGHYILLSYAHLILRGIHEVFDADKVEAVSNVVQREWRF